MRWHGYCTHCGTANVELESRPEHGMRAWCDHCADRPTTTPPLPGFDGPIDLRVSEEEVTRWRAEQRERYGDNHRGELP